MQPPDVKPRTTSRELVARIDRGYYTRPSLMRSWRGWLTLAGLLTAVGWCAWGLLDQPRHHAPGPVAAAHARWERDCQACHIPFAPIKDDTLFTTASTRTAGDAKCEACHKPAAHHPLQLAAEVGSCGSCHVDHRGRAADISRVADRTCTACHADIASHRRQPPPGGPETTLPADAASITRFDDEHHPAFASLAKDPGQLKFSHGRHMTAGLVFGGPSKAAPLTYAMLDADERARLMPRDAGAADLVQLSCNSCHEFASASAADETRLTTTALAAAPAGAYPLPVSFERHCVACHPLPYDPADPAKRLPHGLEPEPMQQRLVAAMLEESAAGRAALDAPLPPRALPANPPEPALPETIRTQVRDRVEKARGFTRGVCGKCHEAVDAPLPVASLLRGPVGPTAASGEAETETWFRVPPVGVPDVWLKKARFNHVPHRGVDCRGCHEAAYPAVASGAASPLDNAIVMIAGRESCTGCHAPSGLDASGKTVGGVRFDCVECHGYHGLGPHDATVAAGAPGAGLESPRAALRSR
jgi:hypothetical protein